MAEDQLVGICRQIRWNGLKEKSAAYQGKKVQFFRGKDFVRCVYKNNPTKDKDLKSRNAICSFGNE